MAVTLGDLAAVVGGSVVGGEASLPLAAAATLETATPADITLVDSPDKLHLLAKSAAADACRAARFGSISRARSLASKWA